MNTACEKGTRGAPRSVPATPAPDCDSWAGWRTGNIQTRGRCTETHHALAARLLGILAEWESKQGRTEYGLRLLDRAENLGAAQDRGVLLLQRGLLFMRTRRGSDALRMLDEAIALLEGNPAESANLAYGNAQPELRLSQRRRCPAGRADATGASGSRWTQATLIAAK